MDIKEDVESALRALDQQTDALAQSRAEDNSPLGQALELRNSLIEDLRAQGIQNPELIADNFIPTDQGVNSYIAAVQEGAGGLVALAGERKDDLNILSEHLREQAEAAAPEAVPVGAEPPVEAAPPAVDDVPVTPTAKPVQDKTQEQIVQEMRVLVRDELTQHVGSERQATYLVNALLRTPEDFSKSEDAFLRRAKELVSAAEHNPQELVNLAEKFVGQDNVWRDNVRANGSQSARTEALGSMKALLQDLENFEKYYPKGDPIAPEAPAAEIPAAEPPTAAVEKPAVPLQYNNVPGTQIPLNASALSVDSDVNGATLSNVPGVFAQASTGQDTVLVPDPRQDPVAQITPPEETLESDEPVLAGSSAPGLG